MKTRKSITSRLKITKNGKVMRRQSFRRHLKANKTAKRLRNLKKTIEMTGFYAKKIRKAVGRRPKSRAKSRAEGPERSRGPKVPSEVEGQQKIYES